MTEYKQTYLEVHERAIELLETASENPHLSKYTDSIEFGLNKIEDVKTMCLLVEHNLVKYYQAEDDVEQHPIFKKMSTLQTCSDSSSTDFTDSEIVETDLEDTFELECDIEKIGHRHIRINVEGLMNYLHGEKLIPVQPVGIV